MNKINFIIGLVCWWAMANAQNNINQYEYWFDQDFTGRVIVNVTPAPLFTLNTAISAGSLGNGLHTFHVRFRDEDSSFSTVVSQFFQKVNASGPGGNTITAFEYWFDGDYAGKVYQTVTPQTSYQLNAGMNTSQLTAGLHTFHTRFQDAGGKWSPVVSQFFQKINQNGQGANGIAAFEYWFDGDYASKVYQAVTPQTLYQLNTGVSAGELANGLHTYHVRFKDIGGSWSSVVSESFQNVIPPSWIGLYSNDQNHPNLGPEFLLDSANTNQLFPNSVNICADGSKTTVVKYVNQNPAIANSNIRFRVKSQMGDDASGFFDPVDTLSSGDTVIARLTHPKFVVPTYFNYFRADDIEVVNNANGTPIYKYPIKVFRAPVVFVHGLWGGAINLRGNEQYF